MESSSVQEHLKTCGSFVKRLENMTLRSTNCTGDFTQVSSEIEMRGIEARRVMRQIRQEVEDCSYRYSHSLKRRKMELESSMKVKDVESKLKEV